jgi:signal transduction histidine kinase
MSVALIGAAADLDERHLSTRPIDNVTTTSSDRKFMTETAADIMRQAAAADRVAQIGLSKEFIEAAHSSRDTLNAISRDLKDLARLKNVALPLQEEVESDLRKLLNSRNGELEREYERFAERSSLRMLERFYDASRKAEDRQVRAFALRYLQPIYGNYEVAKALDASTATVVADVPPKIINTPTNAPLAVVSPPAGQ